MSKRAIGVLSACILTVFAAYAIRYSYGTLLPEMLGALNITKAQAGVIYSSYFIAYTLLSPVTGIMSDKYDMRVIISVFVAVMGLGTFLMQYPTTILQASIFFGIAGIGCAACWAPVMAVAQRWTSAGRRGLTLAIVDAGSTLGVMAAGALGTSGCLFFKLASGLDDPGYYGNGSRGCRFHPYPQLSQIKNWILRRLELQQGRDQDNQLQGTF